MILSLGWPSVRFPGLSCRGLSSTVKVSRVRCYHRHNPNSEDGRTAQVSRPPIPWQGRACPYLRSTCPAGVVALYR